MLGAPRSCAAVEIRVVRGALLPRTSEPGLLNPSTSRQGLQGEPDWLQKQEEFQNEDMSLIA